MTFEEWLFEIENYGTRMERFLSEWDNGMSDKDIMKWMKAAYTMGTEEAYQNMLRNTDISTPEHRKINRIWSEWKENE